MFRDLTPEGWRDSLLGSVVLAAGGQTIEYVTLSGFTEGEQTLRGIAFTADVMVEFEVTTDAYSVKSSEVTARSLGSLVAYEPHASVGLFVERTEIPWPGRASARLRFRNGDERQIPLKPHTDPTRRDLLATLLKRLPERLS